MHGAQAVMPGVACLYRCVGGFVIPDLTNTDNFGITSYSRTQSGSKTDHITPDFCLMRWEQIVFHFPGYIPPGLHMSRFWRRGNCP
uniref:Uncharacterized protein n=1 Tax=Escherichia coli TaxID=562 RepID=A0A3G4RTM4_ECOLX|nr:hypothetical protein D0368_00271 [Escherichia coli]